MRRVTVVRVHHMASRAPARTVVAGMIVRSRQEKTRVKQPRLLQSQKYRIGAKLSPKPAVAQLVIRLSGTLLAAGIPNLPLLLAASFEHAQHISRLRNFPAIQRVQFRQDAFHTSLFSSRRRTRLHRLRLSVAVITFPDSLFLAPNTPLVLKPPSPLK